MARRELVAIGGRQNSLPNSPSCKWGSIISEEPTTRPESPSSAAHFFLWDTFHLFRYTSPYL